MIDICYGELDMTASEYIRTTWAEYVYRQRGWHKRRSYEFEHTRLLYFGIIGPYVKKLPTWKLMTDKEVDVDAEANDYKQMIAQSRARKKTRKIKIPTDLNLVRR